MPNREDWLDLARKVDWEYRYVNEQEVFPAEISGGPWLSHAAWADWNEAYRTTYRDYLANQRSKDDSVMGVRSVLNKAYLREEHDPSWVQLLKFHYGALALAEYAGAVAELRMARFGRDSAWRTMATLGALDEIRHTQIPLLFGHDLLRLDGNFDWTHRAYHTRQWVIIAARHLFDDMFLAADAIDIAVQLNFVFETGFSNLQFLAMAAMADGADDHLFEKALTSIQTDEARHAQIGHPVLRTLIDNGGKERVQYLVDKMWWRCWRLLIALTGTAMEYLTPVRARIEVISTVHGRMGHRPVHDQSGGVRPRASVVLGSLHRGTGLRAPQFATRTVRVSDDSYGLTSLLQTKRSGCGSQVAIHSGRRRSADYGTT